MAKFDLDKQIKALQKQSEELGKKEVEFEEKRKIEEEKKREEERASWKPYKVFGRDFSVLEPNIVEFYKNRTQMMAVQYKLVGKFNETGEYVIPKEIKYDLVAMNKAIEEMGDDYYKASALYFKKYFNFTIKFTMLGDGRARACLYIAEYVGKYADDETIYTFVADFVDEYNEDYRIKLRKAFNLFDVEVKNDDFTVPNLAVVMQDLYDIDQYVGGLYDMGAQIYVMRMLKLLEGSELGDEIIARYKQLLSELGEDELFGTDAGNKFKSKRNTTNEKLKESLDKAIDEKGGLEALGLDEKKRNSVVDEMNKTLTAIGGLKVGGMMEIDLPDRKPEKSGGGSSSKGSSKKKKTKKKDDKDKGKAKEKSKKKKEDKKDEDKPSSHVTYGSSDENTLEGMADAIDALRRASEMLSKIELSNTIDDEFEDDDLYLEDDEFEDEDFDEFEEEDEEERLDDLLDNVYEKKDEEVAVESENNGKTQEENLDIVANDNEIGTEIDPLTDASQFEYDEEISL